jgi:outer membrane protein OmpA-like peptidoglycan-associated protein
MRVRLGTLALFSAIAVLISVCVDAPLVGGTTSGLDGKSPEVIRAMFPRGSHGNPNDRELHPPSTPGDKAFIPNLVDAIHVAVTAYGTAPDGRFANTYFAQGSANIPDDFLPTLNSLGEFLATAGSDETFELHGFTNSDGSEDLNMRLSRARVQGIWEYLHKHYTIRATLTIHAHGEDPSWLARDGDTTEDKVHSRRVMFLQPIRGGRPSGGHGM